MLHSAHMPMDGLLGTPGPTEAPLLFGRVFDHRAHPLGTPDDYGSRVRERSVSGRQFDRVGGAGLEVAEEHIPSPSPLFSEHRQLATSTWELRGENHRLR